MCWQCFNIYRRKEWIIPHDACLTYRCLSVVCLIFKYKPGMFVSSYRDSCLIRICSLESHKKKKKKKKRIRRGFQFPVNYSSATCRDATDHTLIPLRRLCKLHVAGLISIILLGSGWTWSCLVVYINSDSEDYRLYAATLCGSEGDTVTKPCN